MTKSNSDAGKDTAAAKADKLSEALRDNLRRRKNTPDTDVKKRKTMKD